MAMDKIGNVVLGFSVSSRSVFPSVYVAGRAPTDPAGAMFGPLVLVNGSGVQFNSFKRWGDYQRDDDRSHRRLYFLVHKRVLRGHRELQLGNTDRVVQIRYLQGTRQISNLVRTSVPRRNPSRTREGQFVSLFWPE